MKKAANIHFGATIMLAVIALLIVGVQAYWKYYTYNDLTPQQAADIAYGKALRECISDTSSSHPSCVGLPKSSGKWIAGGLRDPGYWVFKYSLGTYPNQFYTQIQLTSTGKELQ